MTSEHTHRTTTEAGIPVASDEHSLTVGPDGPILLHDHYVIEQMANFNRERVPERQPHAKGAAPSAGSKSPATSADTPRLRCSSPARRPAWWPDSPPWPGSTAVPTRGVIHAGSR